MKKNIRKICLLSFCAFAFAGSNLSYALESVPFVCELKETIYNRSGDTLKEFPVRVLRPKRIPTQFGHTRWTLGKVIYEKIVDMYASSPQYASTTDEVSFDATYLEEAQSFSAQIESTSSFGFGNRAETYAPDKSVRKLQLEFMKGLNREKQVTLILNCKLTR